MVAAVAAALIGVATAVVSGISSNSVAKKNQEALAEHEETLRQQDQNKLTADLFGMSSTTTSKGWSELLNIDDVPQTTVLSVLAVLAIFIIVKNKK